MDLLSMVEQKEGSLQRVPVEGNIKDLIKNFVPNVTKKDIDSQYESYVNNNHKEVIGATENTSKGMANNSELVLSNQNFNDTNIDYSDFHMETIQKTNVSGDNSLLKPEKDNSLSYSYESKYGVLQTQNISTNDKWDMYSKIESLNIPNEDKWNMYLDAQLEQIHVNKEEWSENQTLLKSESTIPLKEPNKDIVQSESNVNNTQNGLDKKAPVETNLNDVPVYSAEGSWDQTDATFIGSLPVIGDIKGRVDSALGGNLLFKSFAGEQYAKKTRDPHHLLRKMTWVNTNIIGMAGRFVPQPPNTNSLKWLASDTSKTGITGLDELKGTIASKVQAFAATIPSYPFIPLPTFKLTRIEYTKPLSIEPSKSLYKTYKSGAESNLEYAHGLMYTLIQEDRVSNEYPDFSYTDIEAFEGRTTKYSLSIKKPNGADADLPEFKDYSNPLVSLSSYTTINEIPSSVLKENNKFKMGAFGDYLLGLSFNDYISEIATTTKETADCACYVWAKNYLKYMYNSDDIVEGINAVKHKSIYKSYYNITIHKIYYKGIDAHKYKRIIESRTFYGIPTFNLTEKVSDSLENFEVKWQIIGLDKTSITEQYLDLNNQEKNFMNYGKWTNSPST